MIPLCEQSATQYVQETIMQHDFTIASRATEFESRNTATDVSIPFIIVWTPVGGLALNLRIQLGPKDLPSLSNFFIATMSCPSRGGISSGSS